MSKKRKKNQYNLSNYTFDSTLNNYNFLLMLHKKRKYSRVYPVLTLAELSEIGLAIYNNILKQRIL